MTCSDCEDLQRQLARAKSYGAEQHHTSEERWHRLQREEVKRKRAQEETRDAVLEGERRIDAGERRIAVLEAEVARGVVDAAKQDRLLESYEDVPRKGAA